MELLACILHSENEGCKKRQNRRAAAAVQAVVVSTGRQGRRGRAHLTGRAGPIHRVHVHHVGLPRPLGGGGGIGRPDGEKRKLLNPNKRGN